MIRPQSQGGKEHLMRNRMLVWVTWGAVWVWIVGVFPVPALAQQAAWPPIKVDVIPTMSGSRVTFEVKVTNVVDWTLVDFTLKGSLPANTTFVEAHPDFDGAVVSFDGQDASFFVIGLPAKATIGVRYTVDAGDQMEKVNGPQLWAGWKGRMPGQALFDHSRQLVSSLTSGGRGNTVEDARGHGLTIIEVYGSPYEQGQQRGARLSSEIKAQVTAHLGAVLPRSFGGSRSKWLEAIRPLVDGADRDVVDELRGLADGSGVSLEDLQLADFSTYIAALDSAAASSASCSVLATVGSANQKASLLLGRQQDVAADSVAPVLVIRRFVDGRPARLDLTDPASLDPAAVVTSNGLFWEGHAAFSKESVPAHAADLASAIDSTLSSARTLDDLQTGLTARPRLRAMNAVVADLTSGEVRSLELSSSRAATSRAGKEGILISTNHFLMPDMADLQPPSVNRSLTRNDRLNKLATSRRGQLTLDDIQTFLHDPQVSPGTGLSLAVDADAGRIRLWDQAHKRWFEISLADVFGSSSLGQ
jgi:isopenicillin-N N-acyltransferase like protein